MIGKTGIRVNVHLFKIMHTSIKQDEHTYVHGICQQWLNPESTIERFLLLETFLGKDR